MSLQVTKCHAMYNLVTVPVKPKVKIQYPQENSPQLQQKPAEGFANAEIK